MDCQSYFYMYQSIDKVVLEQWQTFNTSTHPHLAELEMVTFIMQISVSPTSSLSLSHLFPLWCSLQNYKVTNYGLFLHHTHTHTHTDEAIEGRNAYGDGLCKCVCAVVTGWCLGGHVRGRRLLLRHLHCHLVGRQDVLEERWVEKWLNPIESSQ